MIIQDTIIHANYHLQLGTQRKLPSAGKLCLDRGLVTEMGPESKCTLTIYTFLNVFYFSIKFTEEVREFFILSCHLSTFVPM